MTSARAADAPLFSIVTPVFDPPIDVLEETIASVLAQEHRDWEWILVDDASTDPTVVTTITRHMFADPRIRLLERDVNGHIVAASNDGIDAAQGEFVVLLDHDDLLTPGRAGGQRALDRPSTTTSTTSTPTRTRSTTSATPTAASAKPDWSPERLRGQMYTSHLSVDPHLRGARGGRLPRGLRRLPGPRPRAARGRGGAARRAHPAGALPLARRRRLRLGGDRCQALRHAWRVSGPCRTTWTAPASPRGSEQGAEPGRYVIQRELDPGIRVSVVIPTLGQDDIVFGRRRVMVVEAVRSLLARTDHRDIEVVVVHDAPTPAHVLDQLREVAGDRLRARALRQAVQLQREDEPRRRGRDR